MLDAISFHVLNATADDWESLKQIIPQVRNACGLIEPLLIAEVITRLVKEGMLEQKCHFVEQPNDVVAFPWEYWFRMTPQGRTTWESAGPKYS